LGGSALLVGGMWNKEATPASRGGTSPSAIQVWVSTSRPQLQVDGWRAVMMAHKAAPTGSSEAGFFARPSAPGTRSRAAGRPADTGRHQCRRGFGDPISRGSTLL
jgi:hypothetical protein